MRILPLAERKIIRLSGQDCHEFLQGLVTIDIGKLTEENPLWGGILSPQGKVLFDFFLYQQGDNILLDIHNSKAEELVEHIQKFILRLDVSLKIESDLIITAIWETEPDISVKDAYIVVDPRVADMGLRMITDKMQQAAFLGANKSSIAHELDYKSLRIQHDIVDLAVEMDSISYFWPEINPEDFKGVDYKKGCYVGQEVTARLKFKTELRRRIVPVFVMGCPETPIEMATDVQEIGVLVALDEDTGKGLAYVRVDRWDHAIETLRSVMAGPCMVSRG